VSSRKRKVVASERETGDLRLLVHELKRALRRATDLEEAFRELYQRASRKFEELGEVGVGLKRALAELALLQLPDRVRRLEDVVRTLSEP